MSGSVNFVPKTIDQVIVNLKSKKLSYFKSIPHQPECHYFDALSEGNWSAESGHLSSLVCAKATSGWPVSPAVQLGLQLVHRPKQCLLGSVAAALCRTEAGVGADIAVYGDSL